MQKIIGNSLTFEYGLEQTCVFLTRDAETERFRTQLMQNSADVNALAARIAAGAQNAVGTAGNKTLHLGGVIDAGVERDGQNQNGTSFAEKAAGLRC